MTMLTRFRPTAWLLSGTVLCAEPAAAQALAGSYVHQTEQGTIRLVLEQAGKAVTGTMTGVDGSLSRLQGEFDGQKAVGTISTADASGWFAVGFHEGKLTLLIAEVDPSTGQPNLDDGWRLDFTPAGGGTRPGPAQPRATPAPQQPPTQQGAAQEPAVTPLVQQWMQHLRGKRVTFMESYYSNDARGSGGYSTQWDAYLCTDGTFHFRRGGSVSVDAGGYGYARSNNAFSGRWRIIEQSGQAILQYQREEQLGTDEGEWVALGFRDGNTYFDSSKVFVTNENNLCR